MVGRTAVQNAMAACKNCMLNHMCILPKMAAGLLMVVTTVCHLRVLSHLVDHVKSTALNRISAEEHHADNPEKKDNQNQDRQA